MGYGEKLREDNMKILLYGIGKDLADIEEKIKQEHEIIGYMDSFAKINKYREEFFMNYPI